MSRPKGPRMPTKSDLLGAQLERWGYTGQLGVPQDHRPGRGPEARSRNSTKSRTRDFTAVVFNFVDMLSHARTESEILKELAEDEGAYRSLTMSWFEHSPLRELLSLAASEAGMDVVLDLGPRHSPGRQPRAESRERRRSRTTPATRPAGTCAMTTTCLPSIGPGGFWSAQVPPVQPVHLRAGARFHGLPQQLQPLCPLFDRHLPARRHLHGGDARAVGASEPQDAPFMEQPGPDSSAAEGGASPSLRQCVCGVQRAYGVATSDARSC